MSYNESSKDTYVIREYAKWEKQVDAELQEIANMPDSHDAAKKGKVKQLQYSLLCHWIANPQYRERIKYKVMNIDDDNKCSFTSFSSYTSKMRPFDKSPIFRKCLLEWSNQQQDLLDAAAICGGGILDRIGWSKYKILLENIADDITVLDKAIIGLKVTGKDGRSKKKPSLTEDAARELPLPPGVSVADIMPCTRTIYNNDSESTISVCIDIPTSLLSVLHESQHSFVDNMRIAAATKWYEQDKISLEDAAHFANMSLSEFRKTLRSD